MRKFEREQTNSVKFDGSAARGIIDLRKQYDKEAEGICSELTAAIKSAETKFQELQLRYEPKIESIFSGTSLEGTPARLIGIDYSKADQHGVVFAQKLGVDPIDMFLNMLKVTVDNGPGLVDDQDRIYFDLKQGDFSGAWGKNRQSQRESENV